MQAIQHSLDRADFMGAAALAEAALQAGDQGPVLLKLRALRRQEAGQWLLAAADIKAALDAWPEDFSAWNMLGYCQARAGAAQAGLASLDRAIRLKPDFAPAWLNRGWALEVIGELRGARQAYERAMQLDPRDARPVSNLALLAARLGDFEAAESLAEAVMNQTASPNDLGLSAAMIALAMAQLGRGDASVALQGFQAVADRPGVDPHQEAVAHGFMGDALDQLGRTDEAFAAYAAANAGFAEIYAPILAGRESGAVRARRLADSFAALPAWPKRAPGPAAAGPAIAGHVFLLGFPRTGTTLLGQVLDAHPGARTLDERETLSDAGAAYLDSPDGLARLAEAGEAELKALRQAYWDRVSQAGLALDGQVFVDKLPLNTLGLPLIERLFPEARIIFMRRDPRDVVLSGFRQRFVVGPATADFLTLEGGANFFDAVMTLADAYLARLDLPVHTQSYEALVADFEGQTRALCAFVGLAWDKAMADFAARIAKSDVATPSAAQIAKGLYSDGAGQWGRYADQLAPVLPVLEPWIARFGYGGA